MLLSEIKAILDADVVCGEDKLYHEIISACGADLMSDVLAFVKEQGMLLTGLLNPQTIRTADMMDMKCIVFVRGKTPDAAMIKLAESREMIILCTKYPLYQACGLLYSKGLGVKEPVRNA